MITLTDNEGKTHTMVGVTKFTNRVNISFDNGSTISIPMMDLMRMEARPLMPDADGRLRKPCK